MQSTNRTRKELYQLASLNLRELNSVLLKIRLRMDNFEGIGQAKEMHGERVINVGDATQDRDALNYGQAKAEFEEIAKFLTVTEDTRKRNDLDGSLLIPGQYPCVDESLSLIIERNQKPTEKWDDMRVPLITGKPGGTAPSWAVVVGNIYAYHFDDGEIINFTAQIPHSWRVQTDLHLHMHWAATSATIANFDINIEYAWLEHGKAVTTGSLNTTITTPGIADYGQISELGIISGVGHGISAILMCRLQRSAASTGTNYGDQIYISDADFHIIKDNNGSNGEYTK